LPAGSPESPSRSAGPGSARAEEITDVELGNDLGRLLPVELVKLRHPRLHALALRDLHERKAMQYALTGKERLGKGPLCCCWTGRVDGGEKDTWSSAVALALMGLAHTEHRTSLWSHSPTRSYSRRWSSRGESEWDALVSRAPAARTSTQPWPEGWTSSTTTQGRYTKPTSCWSQTGQSPAERAVELKARPALWGDRPGHRYRVERHSLEPWCDVIEAVTDLNCVEDGVANALFAERT